MPRIVFRTSDFLFGGVLGENQQIEARQLAVGAVLEAFPTLENDDRKIEVRWQTDKENFYANMLSVDVFYTVGEHGFDESTAEPAFTEALQKTIMHRLGEHFFANDILGSLDVWVLPQRGACFGEWSRAEWQEAQKAKI